MRALTFSFFPPSGVALVAEGVVRNADAPTRTADGERVFAKPHEEEQDFEEFLDYVIAQEKNPSSTGEIRYAQTRTNFLSSSQPTPPPPGGAS